jgi:hypothetical protein
MLEIIDCSSAASINGITAAADDQLIYEWAEFNLPGGSDLTVLRAQLDDAALMETAA